MSGKRIVLALVCTVTVIALACFASSSLYPAAWLRWRFGVGREPVVDAEWAQVPPTPAPWQAVEDVRAYAYCDRIEVGLGGYCGAGSSSRCNPGVLVYGHASDGGDVAFRILLRGEDGRVLGDTYRTNIQDGYYRWVGGLASQRCDGELATTREPPYNACEFLIHTYGAGGYSLTQYLTYQTRSYSLHVYPEVTYTVQAVASPVVTEYTPDGQFLHRYATGEWNWDAMCEVELRIYYENRRYRCEWAVSGEIPRYEKPTITDVSHEVWNDEGERGYANVSVSFETDFATDGRIYYQIAGVSDPCDPFTGWRQDSFTEGVSHTVYLDPGTLWYVAEQPKTYCYKAVAWPPEYPHVKEARGYTEVYTFTIPSLYIH